MTEAKASMVPSAITWLRDRQQREDRQVSQRQPIEAATQECAPEDNVGGLEDRVLAVLEQQHVRRHLQQMDHHSTHGISAR